MFALVCITVTAILSLPSCIIAMDESNKSSYFTVIPHQQEYNEATATKKLYTLADEMLTGFKAGDDHSFSQLQQVMNEADSFKKTYTKDELFLGSYAYTQEDPMLEFFGQKTHPCRIALFFHQLKQYNNTISTANKKTPNLEEWQAYCFNRSKKETIQDALHSTAKRIGLIIENNDINYAKPPFQAISTEVASLEFEELNAKIIQLCKEKNILHLKALAEIIFVNIVSNVQTPQQ